MLDRQRLVAECQAMSGMLNAMPNLDSRNIVYDNERKDADALPHRRHDLEFAIANLQFGPLAGYVHEIIDKYRAEMPPTEEQTEDHRLWRLALHRMDMRQYVVAKEEAQPAEDDDNESAVDKHKYVRLDLKITEPDLNSTAHD